MIDEYKKIVTSDGTETIYSTEYNETMHSLHGAYTESIWKHINPSMILKAKRDSAKVLDVGFGLGYNVLALITEAERVKPDLKLKIISIEKSESLLPHMNLIKFNDHRDFFYEMVKSAYKKNEFHNDKISIKVIKGDARKYIKFFDDTGFHAVFYDPFSPAKNPELWTVEFLKEVYRHIHNEGVLTTYSSALQVRNGLIEAGFLIGRRLSIEIKKEGTLAAKSRIIELMTETELNEIKENIKSTPYHDLTFNDARDEILQRRIKKMHELRSIKCRPARQG